MIALEDRRSLAHDIDMAHGASAGLRLACGIAGIYARTLQRWKAQAGLVQGDGRPQAVRPVQPHAWSPEGRAEVLSGRSQPAALRGGNARGGVLGHDLFASHRDGALVSLVPDP